MCGCGAWLAAEQEDQLEVAEPISTPTVLEVAEPARAAGTPWPKIDGDLSAIERLNDGYRRIRKEMSKAIVGQERVLEELLIAIFARGHCLLVGVPGLAKTLMIRTLADSLSLSFSRVQFTPDLMPSDITGTEVLQEDKTTGQRVFKFLHGPLFANIVLADEINRTPPKTQAALLEAMQERQVTVGGTRHKLPDPFFVLATQNPIEQEGTYPLPEAQQDRFMFNIWVDYPEEEEEFKIVEMTTSTMIPKLDRVLSATDVLEMQDIVRKVPVAPVCDPLRDEVPRASTRKGSRVTTGSASTTTGPGKTKDVEIPAFIRDYVTLGAAGPRATQFLILSRPRREQSCFATGAMYVSCERCAAGGALVLRHRIITNFNAEAEGIKPDTIVQRLIDVIPRDPNEKA